MSHEHYPVLWIGQTAVVTLPAEIDITNADQVREDLLSVRDSAAHRDNAFGGNATTTADTDGGAA